MFIVWMGLITLNIGPTDYHDLTAELCVSLALQEVQEPDLQLESNIKVCSLYLAIPREV